MSASDYPNFDNFLACYFHQDWIAEFSDSDAAIDRFLQVATNSTAASVTNELRTLLATTDDARLLEVLDEMGFAFDFEVEPGESRAWLTRVLARLASRR